MPADQGFRLINTTGLEVHLGLQIEFILFLMECGLHVCFDVIAQLLITIQGVIKDIYLLIVHLLCMRQSNHHIADVKGNIIGRWRIRNKNSPGI